jgi:outer membrane protein assembly factor BamB
MPRITSIILLCVLSFCLTWQTADAQQVASKSWPWWMGANFDGISNEAGWSTTWPEETLPVAWTNEIGIGFSSMSIVDGRLFTMGNLNGNESVYCFDAKTGKEIWRHSYECELVAVLYEGGPGSTPTIDGENLYAVGKEGQLMCLRASDGEKVWEKSLQDDLGVPLPEWGFNASPFILGDQLILEVGRLVSYNKTTGEKNWQTDTHDSGYGSVREMKRDGQSLLVSLDCDGLRINRADDGSEVVFEPWPSLFRTNSTTPIVHENTIFVSTAYDVGCILLRLNGDKLEEVYANREMRNHFNNSILFEGNLYGFDGNSNLGRTVHLKCMNHQTGEIRWKHRGLGCGSLMIADGKLLLLSEDGRLVVAEANPDGFKQLAESQILEGRCWTVPVLLDGRVYARNAAGKLVCVELPVDE